MTKIGVFDSGVGGLSVARVLRQALPTNEVIFANDATHVPYGSKPLKQIHGYVLPILQEMVAQGCELIVIACNTVTTNLITQLREELAVPLVGMEPMVKVAAKETKSNKIIVCATPATLRSERYKYLKAMYAAGVEVIEPDCSEWSSLIESNRINHDHIKQAIEPGLLLGADRIVLGCTHYHWIENDIAEIAKGRAEVMHPEQPVVAQVKRVLARLP